MSSNNNPLLSKVSNAIESESFEIAEKLCRQVQIVFSHRCFFVIKVRLKNTQILDTNASCFDALLFMGRIFYLKVLNMQYKSKGFSQDLNRLTQSPIVTSNICIHIFFCRVDHKMRVSTGTTVCIRSCYVLKT